MIQISIQIQTSKELLVQKREWSPPTTDNNYLYPTDDIDKSTASVYICGIVLWLWKYHDNINALWWGHYHDIALWYN